MDVRHHIASFVIAKGRGYYLAPAYPMLYAAGAVVCEDFFPLLVNMVKGPAPSVMDGIAHQRPRCHGHCTSDRAFQITLVVCGCPD
jgi:hypothetical protein